MKRFCLGCLLLLGLSLVALAQDSASPAAPQSVSRVTKAVNYRRTGSTKVSFRGTDQMQLASGEAKVQTRTGHFDVDLRVSGLEQPTKFGLEYLTYVLWAISPQGRADNLGELVLDHGASHLRATTDLQTFGMVVTAEPYFAVTQPSNLVVLENDFAAGGEPIESSYELLPRGAYSSSNEQIHDAIFGIDSRIPLELLEARNAIRIARAANADKYSADAFHKAEKSLADAETGYRQKQNRNSIASLARDAAQTAEDARVMATKQREQERVARANAEREAQARAQAELEAQRRRQAELDRQTAEAARAEAEHMRQEAEVAAKQAAQAKAEADAARAAAEEQQKQLAQEAEKASQAAADAERARQQAEAARQQAEHDKADIRAKLLQQLNAVLETRDSARGLIANMGDVLFETGKYELKPAARERLAKVSGILLAYSGLKVQVEGHTDSVGSDDFNQKLSEDRANAVRDYLAEQGVPDSAISSLGMGKLQPIADNATPEGRQRNRRVELVVNGDAIGGTATTTVSAKQ